MCYTVGLLDNELMVVGGFQDASGDLVYSQYKVKISKVGTIVDY